jgi:hypothetical protein
MNRGNISAIRLVSDLGLIRFGLRQLEPNWGLLADLDELPGFHGSMIGEGSEPAGWAGEITMIRWPGGH